MTCEVCGEQHATLYSFEGYDACAICCMQMAQEFGVHPSEWSQCVECGEVIPPGYDYAANANGPVCGSCLINVLTPRTFTVVVH
jgi:hypothetical protein